MATKEPQSRIGGRDSRSGRFIPVEETKWRPDTTQRERIPLPGYGDTGRYDKGRRSDLAPDVPPPPPIRKTKPR